MFLHFPRSLHIDNYIRAWELGNLGLYTLNSIFYTAVSTTVTVFLALAAGYAFAKFNFHISRYLYGFFIIGLLITVHSVLVPLVHSANPYRHR